MAELTLESLSAEFKKIQKESAEKIATLEAIVETLNAKLEDLQIKAPADSKTSKDEKPTIPDTEITRNKVKYKFAKAQFLLPGDPNKYTAEQAATEANKKYGLIDRILAIPGQKILVEAV